MIESVIPLCRGYDSLFLQYSRLIVWHDYKAPVIKGYMHTEGTFNPFVVNFANVACINQNARRRNICFYGNWSNHRESFLISNSSIIRTLHSLNIAYFPCFCN